MKRAWQAFATAAVVFLAVATREPVDVVPEPKARVHESTTRTKGCKR